MKIGKSWWEMVEIGWYGWELMKIVGIDGDCGN